ncbi:MAG: RecX family transcriptional regulator [Bacilli bacterium]|jgi:SOS response regulatory protein OraA/RecX|nr:RecX family transcriptional regulator [Bacilli bacterium]
MPRPVGNTGSKTILRLEFNREEVSVFFTDGTSFQMTNETYLDGEKLYPGKELSLKTIKALSESKDEINLLSYLALLLSSGRLYSRKKLVEKLMKVKKASYVQAQEAVIKAEHQGIYDEKAYITGFIQASLNKGCSKEKVIYSLKGEGIKEEEIRPLLISSFEKEDISAAAENALKTVHGRNLLALEDNAINKLVKLGWGQDEARKALKKILKDDPDLAQELREKELSSLKEELRLEYLSLKGRGMEEEEIKERLIRKLTAHRYSYNDIIKEMEGLK